MDRFSKLVHWSIRNTLERSPYKSRHDFCEDVFQEFFKKLLQREELASLKESANLKKFLVISSANLTLDRLKALSRYEKATEPLEAFSPEDPGKGAAHEEAMSLVREVLEELTGRERVCVELHYLDGSNHRQIAEILNLPLDTVSSVIRRTREKLKERLIERGLEEA